jgi:regulator of nucleoside diphosphate kinase
VSAGRIRPVDDGHAFCRVSRPIPYGIKNVIEMDDLMATSDDLEPRIPRSEARGSPTEQMIDQTLERSFPASDPQSWTLGNRTVPTLNEQSKERIMSERQICVTESDFRRIRGVIGDGGLDEYEDVGDLNRLRYELERALIVKPTEIPKDVVTMNSRIRLRDLDSGDAIVFSLVYPSFAYRPDAGVSEMTVSVLAPVGTAILGYRVGDTIEWNVPSGARRLKVEDVLYQPEASGHHDL